MTLKRNDKSATVDADFTVKLTEFGVEIPKYLGITVAEDVNVHVNSSAQLKD